MRDTNSFCRWSVISQLLKTGEHALVHDHHLMNSNGAYASRSGVIGQERRRHLFVQDVSNAHVDNAYAIIFFERSCLANQTLHRICERRSALRNCRRYIRYIAQFDCVSWRSGLAANTKREAQVHVFQSPLHATFVTWNFEKVARMTVIEYDHAIAVLSNVLPSKLRTAVVYVLPSGSPIRERYTVIIPHAYSFI